jgi:hypothetical protein
LTKGPLAKTLRAEPPAVLESEEKPFNKKGEKKEYSCRLSQPHKQQERRNRNAKNKRCVAIQKMNGENNRLKSRKK